METTVLIALGSNRRHGRHGAPEQVVVAALAALAAAGLPVLRRSRIRPTPPLGPGGRRFANAAAMVVTEKAPLAVLAILKQIERDFGRRRARRWGDRVLDLDILGAGELVVRMPGLQIPHPALAFRRFVLDPLAEISPDWRHPVSHLTARQLQARCNRPKARRHGDS
ncbi:2-amino-4-hydroxy-6-hydroxymethyldihydropteridine diphosphokinase [Sandarakinorhabdus sp.]|uniref:2-amino-4-hydroxy-6- hydroxymethyldihydropteridine diphosphokinase n=1 Tax=Sandarakinorhabdus sp. TaxID=1916663 RepID=UPI00286E5AEB|nr:2-amino-4-hydroxy-6-hydroxymethyldihydropteridine diphosphokinase [Sandarakinorhabdus sp.]